MALIGSVWVQTSWVSVGGWAAGTWANRAAPVVVAEELKGGRRIYDPDDKHEKVKTRRLTRDERRELDRMFRANAQPRYVTPSPPPAPVVRRSVPLSPVVVRSDPPQPVDRIVAARQFMALDALDSFLEQYERDEPARLRAAAHQAAQRHAEWLATEQRRLVGIEMQRQADQRVAEQAAFDAWQAAEIQRQADEDEMMGLLLLIHEDAV